MLLGLTSNTTVFAQTTPALACAAYANNATALYVRLLISPTVDTARFFQGSGAGTAINQNNVEQLITPINMSQPNNQRATQPNGGNIYKITISQALTDATTTIQYKDTASSPAILLSATCSKDTNTADAMPDVDGDKTPDANDRNPFVDHQPTITVSNASAKETARTAGTITYEFTFIVTTDEPVPALAQANIYFVNAVFLNGSVSFTSPISTHKTTASGSNTQAKITVIASFNKTDLNSALGFTLSHDGGHILVDRTKKLVLNIEGDTTPIGGIFSPKPVPNPALATIPTVSGALECAAINPDGQSALYVQIDAIVASISSFTAIRTAGFTVGGTAVPANKVSPLGSISNNYGVARISLSSPVSTTQTVSYKHVVSSTAITANCVASETDDYDRDNIPDISDSNPFRLFRTRIRTKLFLESALQ